MSVCEICVGAQLYNPGLGKYNYPQYLFNRDGGQNMMTRLMNCFCCQCGYLSTNWKVDPNVAFPRQEIFLRRAKSIPNNENIREFVNEYKFRHIDIPFNKENRRNGIIPEYLEPNNENNKIDSDKMEGLILFTFIPIKRTLSKIFTQYDTDQLQLLLSEYNEKIAPITEKWLDSIESLQKDQQLNAIIKSIMNSSSKAKFRFARLLLSHRKELSVRPCEVAYVMNFPIGLHQKKPAKKIVTELSPLIAQSPFQSEVYLGLKYPAKWVPTLYNPTVIDMGGKPNFYPIKKELLNPPNKKDIFGTPVITTNESLRYFQVIHLPLNGLITTTNVEVSLFDYSQSNSPNLRLMRDNHKVRYTNLSHFSPYEYALDKQKERNTWTEMCEKLP